MSAGVGLRRLLVAVDAAVHDRSQLAAAAEVAARLRSEVCALFVEDLDLLRAAALPFMREIDLLTAATAALDVDIVERRLRQLAHAARAELAAAAERLRVAWTFEVVRGRLGEVAAAAPDADLLLLPDRPRAAGGRVLVLHGGGPHETAALQRARQLAGGEGFDIVAPPAAGVGGLDVATLRSLRRGGVAGLCVVAAGVELPDGMTPAALAVALGCPVLLLST